MELKVWVEGIQRIVCGVTETTTCQDVVLALAHATGKVGRFTLIERWRNNERLLAPQEYPLKILIKWGEYSNDIQFILRRSENTEIPKSNQNTNRLSGSNSTSQQSHQETLSPSKLSSPFNPHGSPSNPVGVVKGVQQQGLIRDRESPSQKDVPPYRDPPPPYRLPPPPKSNVKTKYSNDDMEQQEIYSTQYRALVSLLNHQREQLSSQQADLIKFDAEIGFWETRGRENERQAEIIQQQITTADTQLKISSEQVQALTFLEEESELEKQKEKTLKSELMLVRSKLSICESDLLQVRNKMRRLLSEIEQEQHYRNGQAHESRQALERSILAEMETIQNQIQQAKHAAEINHLTAETLKREVGVLETAIMDKKRQVEQLVSEMKEANLQSLAGSADELRFLLEGAHKPGSARKIIGSPRQLENAVPTNKNPHGVWV